MIVDSMILAATSSGKTMQDRPARLRSAVAIARAVIRDLAAHDSRAGAPEDPLSQIQAWLRDAAAAGDTAVVDAIDVLGVPAAAEVYSIGRRSSSLTPAEREKLARFAQIGRGR